MMWRGLFGLFNMGMTQEFTTSNIGYATLGDEDLEGLGLLSRGIPGTFRNAFDRLRYQMYHFAVIEQGQLLGQDLSDKVVLDTSCGRGGGLNYLTAVLYPHQAIGLDISRASIEFCRQQWPKGHHVSTEFIQGDAEHLSVFVPRHSVDMIVDIEGFFYYQDKHAYLREAHDVLKEGGRLFLSFFIQRTRLEEIHTYLRQYFDIVREDDITDNVLHAIRLDSQRLAHYAD